MKSGLMEDMIAHADEARAVRMKRYLRDQFEFLGLHAGLRREIAKPYMAEVKKEAHIDWDFVHTFWDAPYRECQYTACDYLRMKRNLLTPEDVPELKSLALQKSWWDTVDVLDLTIADIAKRHTGVNEVLLDWSLSDSIWLRRISINHQRLRKEETDTGLLEKILVNNLGRDEFFINKAIGWALRAYSRTDPRWVRAFIQKHEDGLSRLSIREGSKYL